MNLLFAVFDVKSGFVFFGVSTLVACGLLYVIIRKPKDGQEDGGDLEL